MDLGQVFTREIVADYMVSLFELDKEAKILDPCFGDGAFLNACKKQGYNNLVGCEIDNKLYEDVIQSSESHIKLINGDFLQMNNDEKFDGIIMNPPYIRQEKIDDLYMYGITKEKLRENSLFIDLPKTANMYMYFIIKAIELLEDDGQLIVIFPSSWLNAKSGEKFENIIKNKSTIMNEIHISGQVFEKNALVEVVILVLEKGKKTETIKRKRMEIRNDNFIEKNLVDSNQGINFDIDFNKFATVRRGLTSGYNEMFINPNFKDDKSKNKLIPIISSPKSVYGYNTEGATIDYLLKIEKDEVLNDELFNYIKLYKKKIMKNGAPKTLLKKINENKLWYYIKLIDSKGIIFSYFVRNDMKFIDNSNGILTRDNFYIIYPKIDYWLLFSLLNNYYVFYQLEKSGKKYGAGLLKLQRYDIENLKFPNVDIFTEADISNLKKLAKELAQKGNVDTIDDITKILSRYSNVDYEKIKCQYLKIKSHRLEEY